MIQALSGRGIRAEQVVVADDDNLDLAKEFGFHTVEQNNDYLGRKFNDGWEYAFCELGARWVAPLGSDSWVHPAVFVHDYRPRTIYTSAPYCVVDRTGTRMLVSRVDGFGAGPHVYPRSLAKLAGFRPANDTLPSGIDTSSVNTIMRAAEKHGVQVSLDTAYFDDYQYVGFRSERNITTYEAMQRRWGGREEPLSALAGHYPDDLLEQVTGFYAGRAGPAATVCLTMIVKDEADYITAAIESARGLFDMAAIVDTGSTDGTQDLIRELIPGVLLEEHPWEDFATNRNQALRLAEASGCDYLFVLDADDELVDKPHGGWGPLGLDAYYLHYAGPVDYAQPRLVRAGLGWEWKDKVHAWLTCPNPEARSSAHLYKPLIKHHGWERHAKHKAAADIVQLRRMLDDQPTTRDLFNIGKAMEGLGYDKEAVAAYRVCADASQDDEERWFAQYRVGDLLCHKSFNDGAEALMEAWRMRPWRNEPLRRLAAHCENVADRTPYPYGDMRFIRRDWYK